MLVAWLGRSLQNIGTGTNFPYQQDVHIQILEMGISVLVLASIVQNVAKMVGIQDNLLQRLFSAVLRH